MLLFRGMRRKLSALRRAYIVGVLLTSSAWVAEGLTCDEIAARAVDMGSCKLATQQGYQSVTPEGTLPILEGAKDIRIFWREFWVADQDPAKTMPILVVHGGPGGTHDYMLPLRFLACRPSPSGTHYRVIFYDQLGSGLSARKANGMPQEPAVASVWYSTTELQAIVQGVVLRKNNGPFHLFGHGFGGLLALSYATVYPDFTQAKMASLILSSPSAPNMESVVAGIRANMQAQLSEENNAELLTGNSSDPTYNSALQSFFTQLVLRTSPVPDCVADTLAGRSDAVRSALWGDEPWILTGNAKTVDLKRDLPRILVPTFAFVGQLDEFPQSTMVDLSGGTSHIPWIHTEVVPDSGHVTHIDNFAYVYSSVNKWLDDTDSQPFFQAMEKEASGDPEEKAERERQRSRGREGGKAADSDNSIRSQLSYRSVALATLLTLTVVAIMGTVGYRRARQRLDSRLRSQGQGSILPYQSINS